MLEITNRWTKKEIENVSKWHQDQLIKMEEYFLTLVRMEHTQRMVAMDQLVHRVESRLLDVSYVRHPTLRDASLVETSICTLDVETLEKKVLVHLIKKMFQAIHPDLGKINVEEDATKKKNKKKKKKKEEEEWVVYCDKKDCGLQQNIQQVWNLNKFMMVFTCSRHQQILESMEGVIILSSMAWEEEKVVLWANVIRTVHD